MLLLSTEQSPAKKVRVIKPLTMCSQCYRPYNVHQGSSLGHQFTAKFVGGVVNYSKELGKDFPFCFFEIDTTDESVHQTVLDTYAKYNVDVISHRIGKGYHYFGNVLSRELWKDWYAVLKPLNIAYPPLTLRITRKFDDEVFEKPIYHEAQNVVPNWSKSIMHFLNKEKEWKNSTDIRKAIYACGIPKYFKETVYPIVLKETQ